MTNQEYAKSLSDEEFADWVYERVIHWVGVTEFTEWLNAERTDL